MLSKSGKQRYWKKKINTNATSSSTNPAKATYEHVGTHSSQYLY
jgi:hypothetical protein